MPRKAKAEETQITETNKATRAWEEFTFAGGQRTVAVKRAFLEVFTRLGTVWRGCQAAQISRTQVYKWLKNDAVFAEAFTVAEAEFADRLEDAILGRATRGVQKGIYYKGKRIDTVTEYSDRLGELAMKAHKPEKYREHVDLNANVTGGVLVVPAAPAQDDWNKAAKEQQDALQRSKTELVKS